MPAVPRAAHILIVDDEPGVAAVIERMTRYLGHTTVITDSAEAALREVAAGRFDVVLTDLQLGTMDGLALLRRLRESDRAIPVVLVTGFATIPSAMEAIQAGAFDYIAKPLTLEALSRVLVRAIEQRDLGRLPDEAPLKPGEGLTSVVGTSPSMLEVFKTVARVADRYSTVLILGESGTGKELVARALHERSPRASRNFVAVNVAAMSEGILESELFGHLKGSFTGATAARRGLFEEAHLGTLFLDEIGDISPAIQVKLLRALQEHRIKPVGGNDEIEVDVRLVAATHRDIPLMMREGRFREDLYYRLNVVTIVIPPLRERKEDILALVEHFRRKLERESGKPSARFSPEALEQLASYDWPGNVRELENYVARAVLLSPFDTLGPESLPPFERSAAVPVASPEGFPTLATVIEDYVRRVLEHTGGNRTRAAQILGISRRTIHRMARREDSSDE